MASKLDTHDLNVLRRVADGERFLKHVSHWNRACDMVESGHLTSEMAVWKWTHGGERVEYRQRFALTDKGRQALDARAAGKGE